MFRFKVYLFGFVGLLWIYLLGRDLVMGSFIWVVVDILALVLIGCFGYIFYLEHQFRRFSK